MMNYTNGYNLDENEYEKLVTLFYNFEEYYYNKNIKYYNDYIKVIKLLDDVRNNKVSEEIKNAVLGWYIFFKTETYDIPTDGFCFDITDACQLKCKHCYNQNFERTGTFLSYSDFVKIFYKHLEICKVFNKKSDIVYPKTCFIKGGEATLHPELDKMITFLNSKNVNVNLETNGIYIPDTIIDILTKRKTNRISISIDGMEDSHDFIRGVGSFKKSVDTIKSLLDKGFNNISTNFVVNSYNYKDVSEYKKFFGGLGVKQRSVMRYIDQNNPYISPINKEQSLYISDYLKMEPSLKCSVGKQFVITCNGGWKCCNKSALPELANYLTDSVEDFIKKIRLFTIRFRSVPVYCFDCKKVNTCMGGELCSKMSSTKKFNQEDLTCTTLNCKEYGDMYKIDTPF